PLPWFNVSGLTTHATESSVDILIVRLEPIAKRRPQHAGRGAHRRAFHYVVPSIEEVRGVDGIKLICMKARERFERARRPFPSVAHESVDTEDAAGVCKRIDGGRIPSSEIEVTVL